jgi:hypothetical protein
MGRLTIVQQFTAGARGAKRIQSARRTADWKSPKYETLSVVRFTDLIRFGVSFPAMNRRAIFRSSACADDLITFWGSHAESPLDRLRDDLAFEELLRCVSFELR